LRKAANAEIQAKRKEEARILKERRDEKAKRERDWEELYGDARVRSEGRLNVADDDNEEGGGAGWDEDDFM
jgi:hypothetical protein